LKAHVFKYLEQRNAYVTHESFPTPQKKNERRKEKEITRVASLLPKQTSKAYVTLQGYDKVVNTKDPNI
jgi:hypothetical protein